MKVLVVARYKENAYAPFITEQVEALEKQGVECRYFGINDKGLFGYLKHIRCFRRAIREFNPDAIHAHYGLCGLFANQQRRVPVITTYHGTDINNPRMLRVSRWAIRLSAFNVFVSEKNYQSARPPKDRSAIIPCGINLADYPLLDKDIVRATLGWVKDRSFILFSGAFDNRIKNAPLAQAAVEHFPYISLIELKGYTRSQVAHLMNAADGLVMTSFSEGSPQVIKEALACGCPIISVDVGDVKNLITGIDGCYIAERSAESIATNIKKAIEFGKRTDGRQVIEERGLTNETIAKKLIDIYNIVVNR